MSSIPEKLSIATLKKFIENNYLKNRTIVSSDISTIFDDIETTTGLTILRHKFRTGEDHGTWIVPKQWDIKSAWLKDLNGVVIASYDEHPLFVSPYSCPIHKKVKKEELLQHIVSAPQQPDAFAFNWRYASDARLQLKDWGLSIPHERLKGLTDDEYELFIDVDVSDGDMLVGEIVIPGRRKDTMVFVANYCHPGQVNDSFSGLVLFMKVMHELSQNSNLEYTYKFIFCQETIGSAIYVASDPTRLNDVIGAMFSEMVAWGEKWFIKSTRTGDTLMDGLARECTRSFDDLSQSEFFSLIGNDEYILNSVQTGIPTLSLQKYPFDEYHTSNDNPSHIRDEDIQRAVDITMHMVDVLEKNAVYKFVHRVPFWMTRYNLYSDDVYQPDDFLKQLKIVYQYLDGKNSILDIAEKIDAPFDYVYRYVLVMLSEGLVKKIAS